MEQNERGQGIWGSRKDVSRPPQPMWDSCPSRPQERSSAVFIKAVKSNINSGGKECPPHARLRSPCRCHVGSGDAVVPAELVFVEEAPGIPQSERQSREHRRQNAPTADTKGHRTAVEAV